MPQVADALSPSPILILQSIPPESAIYTGIAVLLVVCTFSFLPAYPSHTQAHQRAQGAHGGYDDLVDLFESIERLLKLLEIYTQVPPTPTTDDMVVNIMVELLSTLALTTKELNEGRSSEFLFSLMSYRNSMQRRAIHKEDFWRKGRRGDPPKTGPTLPKRGSEDHGRDSQGRLRSRPGYE
jgi:hypothetical protein